MLHLKKLEMLRTVAIAAALLSLIGCESMTGHHDKERSQGRIVDDKAITQNIKDELKREPVYRFDTVNVETFAGVVQLSGFVNTEEQKTRAGELASKTSGVHQVVNGIALKPEPMSPTGVTPSQPRIFSE